MNQEENMYTKCQEEAAEERILSSDKHQKWLDRQNEAREELHSEISYRCLRFLYENKMAAAACEEKYRGNTYLVKFSMEKVI